MTKTEEKITKSSKVTQIEIEEYRALRAEILTYISAKQNLIYLSVLVILALLGLQITTKLCLFSLCTIVTIIVFYNQDFRYKIGIAECGAYIRARFEHGSNGFNWETTLSKLNLKYDKQKENKNVTWSKKYKKCFKSIFDSGIFNSFTSFSLISLIVGWFPLLEKLNGSNECVEKILKSETTNIVIMGVATFITFVFFIYMVRISRRNFNRIRKEFYVNIKKVFRKSMKLSN